MSGTSFWAAPHEHIWYLKENFSSKHIICAIVECAALDAYFSPAALLEGGVLARIGVSVGDMPLASMLFLVDMMRIGMAEVYGHYFGLKGLLPCYRRMCGDLNLTSLGARERRLLCPMFLFFCEQMLRLRGRIRFQKGLASYLCKRALEAPLVHNQLNTHRLEGLKDVLHFSGLRLYELAMVSDPARLFASAKWQHALMKRQLQDYAGKGLRIDADDVCTEQTCHAFLQGPSESVVAHGGVDVWGNSGPDMMHHALTLFTTRAECGGQAPEKEDETDFSKLPF
jgi:hypothetical protein